MNNDIKYMKKCLELAKKGIGRVSPNPLVGCIIVKNGKIISKGYHRYFGGAHAEIMALKLAGSRANRGTMYINLEPCCHIGKKTPPCVPEIITAGIKEVVIAMKDPNPAVNGKGIEALRKSGIKVKVGEIEKEAQELNKFYTKWITKSMPYVVVKVAMSLDGKIATRTGASKWITGIEARRFVWHLRSQVDAVLVGINTVIKDNPFLTTHNLGRNPVRVILDPELAMPFKANVLLSNTSRIIIFTGVKKYKVKHELSKKKCLQIVHIPSAREGIFDLKQIMNFLAKMGISSVMIEGGGTTIAHAFIQRIVDEVYIFIAPIIIGGAEAKTPVEGAGVKNISQAIRILDTKVEKVGSDFLIHGKLH